jgi:hypothetical protein
MKKLLVIAVMALAAAAAFAQNAPANEVYGRAWFEYAINNARLSAATPVLGDYTFARLRFGMRNQLSDTLKTCVEVDPRNLEFRLAYAEWVPLSGLTIAGGKYSKFFAQTNGWTYGSRTYGASVKYAMSGIGWGGIQLASTPDVAFQSGVLFAFPGTTSFDVQPTVAATTDLNLSPWLAVKPDLGKDISLEIGANAELNLRKVALPIPSGASVDGYLLAGFQGLSLATEFTFKNINDSVTANQDMTFFAQVTYTLGSLAPFAPTAYLVWDNIQKTTPDMTLWVELPWTIQRGLVISPIFSYAPSGKNINTGVTSTPGDWSLELRLDWAISAKF